MIKRYYTNSEMQVFRDCIRKWYLSEYRMLSRVHEDINESREIGNFVHGDIADLYNNPEHVPGSTVTFMAAKLRAQQEKLANANEGAQLLALENIKKIDAAEAYAMLMVEGYVQWLEEEGADSYLRFISAEEEIAIRFPSEGLPKDGVEEPMLLAKLDARFLDERTAARVFMDHKSVQNFKDRETWAHLDPQFLYYSLIDWLLLLEQEVDDPDGQWTDGGIINMLRRVKRTGSAKPPFFKRMEVRHSMIELRNYFVRVAGEITRIQQTELALAQGVDHHLVCPPSPSKDCSWKCPFMQLCAMMDDGSDSEMYIGAALQVRDPLDRYESVTKHVVD